MRQTKDTFHRATFIYLPTSTPLTPRLVRTYWYGPLDQRDVWLTPLQSLVSTGHAVCGECYDQGPNSHCPYQGNGESAVLARSQAWWSGDDISQEVFPQSAEVQRRRERLEAPGEVVRKRQTGGRHTVVQKAKDTGRPTW